MWVCCPVTGFEKLIGRPSIHGYYSSIYHFSWFTYSTDQTKNIRNTLTSTIPELCFIFLRLESPEPLYYVCQCVCLSVCHTCGQRGARIERATKTNFGPTYFLHLQLETFYLDMIWNRRIIRIFLKKKRRKGEWCRPKLNFFWINYLTEKKLKIEM